MSDWRSTYYWRKPLTLAELMEELENDDDIEVPDSISIFPPENANDDCDTEEDSGDENGIELNNLPGSQLRSEVNVFFQADEWDTEDERPLSEFVERKPKMVKQFTYSQNDLNCNFCSWENISFVPNNLSPLACFRLFFDKDVIDSIICFTNKYAEQKNRPGNVTEDELLCFIAVLLLSGYVTVPRKKMYWQNRDDVCNNLVSNAISRDRFQYIMSHIHCNDNTKLDKKDKYSKLRPLFDL